MAIPKLVQDRRDQKSWSPLWLEGERSLPPTVPVPSPVLPGSPIHHPEGTTLPSQLGPAILSTTGLCWGTSSATGAEEEPWG